MLRSDDSREAIRGEVDEEKFRPGSGEREKGRNLVFRKRNCPKGQALIEAIMSVNIEQPDLKGEGEDAKTQY